MEKSGQPDWRPARERFAENDPAFDARRPLSSRGDTPEDRTAAHTLIVEQSISCRAGKGAKRRAYAKSLCSVISSWASLCSATTLTNIRLHELHMTERQAFD